MAGVLKLAKATGRPRGLHTSAANHRIQRRYGNKITVLNREEINITAAITAIQTNDTGRGKVIVVFRRSLD